MRLRGWGRGRAHRRRAWPRHRRPSISAFGHYDPWPRCLRVGKAVRGRQAPNSAGGKSPPRALPTPVPSSARAPPARPQSTRSPLFAHAPTVVPPPHSPPPLPPMQPCGWVMRRRPTCPSWPPWKTLPTTVRACREKASGERERKRRKARCCGKGLTHGPTHPLASPFRALVPHTPPPPPPPRPLPLLMQASPSSSRTMRPPPWRAGPWPSPSPPRRRARTRP